MGMQVQATGFQWVDYLQRSSGRADNMQALVMRGTIENAGQWQVLVFAVAVDANGHGVMGDLLLSEWADSREQGKAIADEFINPQPSCTAQEWAEACIAMGIGGR